MKVTSVTALAAGIIAALVGQANAAILASDSAADATYASGWATATATTSSGTWGGGWTFSNTSGNGSQNGQFTASSTTNAGGSSGGIDTSGRAWGMYANSGQTANAIRPFSGALSVGQGFNVSIDNGYIDNSSVVGFGLRTASGTARFEFYYRGGDAVNSYKVNRSGGEANLSPNVGFTGNGLRLEFTLTGTDTYSLLVKDTGGTTLATNTGTLAGVSGTGIEQVRLFNFNAGSGGNNNAFFNSIAVVPEPTTAVLAGLGLLGAVRRRRSDR